MLDEEVDPDEAARHAPTVRLEGMCKTTTHGSVPGTMTERRQVGRQRRLGDWSSQEPMGRRG